MAEQLRYGPVARRALRSLVRSLPLLAFVAACVPDDAPPRSDSSATPVLSPAPAARVDSTPATAPASTPPPPAETTLPDVVTPDSVLPNPSYAGLPGWFVAGGRGLPRHIGVPNDTAQATLFLLSDAASFLTGVTLDIAGGRVML